MKIQPTTELPETLDSERVGDCPAASCSALPCPFCGFEEPDEPKLGVRTCPNCAAVGPSDLGAWGTISDNAKHDHDVWNRRELSIEWRDLYACAHNLLARIDPDGSPRDDCNYDGHLEWLREAVARIEKRGAEFLKQNAKAQASADQH